MEEPNRSALALLQQEASELLALFDQLRGDTIPRCAAAADLSSAATRSHEHPARLTH